MRFHVSMLAACWIAAFSTAVAAQSYPVKPIRVVVPNPAGGIDVYARPFMPRFQEITGQPIIIENRAGASGAIGAENIARSAPDGYSLLFATSAVMVTSPVLNKSLPYHPVRDFTPVSKLFEPVEALVVSTALPVSSVKELIDYARRNPGKLTYGSSGIGSVPHFNVELLKAAAGVDLLHVPYKGVAQIIPELVAGRIDVAIPGVGSVVPMIASGKMKLLAVLDEKRYGRMPEVPTVAETLPAFRQAPIWFGLFGPAGMPRPVAERLRAAILRAVETPEVRSNYESGDMRIVAGTPDELAASMRADAELTAQLVKSIGLKPE